MWRRVKRLVQPRTARVREIAHPTLGTLTYDAERENWAKQIGVSGEQIRLSVGGEQQPDPELLKRVAMLETGLPIFLSVVRAFLETEASRTPHLEHEIRSLRLEELAVWWPQQPDAAMLWFKGPSGSGFGTVTTAMVRSAGSRMMTEGQGAAG